MRIAMIVLSILFLVATAGLGLLGTRKGFRDARNIDREYGAAKSEIAAMAKAGDHDAQQMVSLGEGTGRMRAGAGLMAGAAVLALALVVMLFVKKGVPWLAIGVVACALLAMVLLPQYETGPLEGASPRTLAYLVAALGGVGAAAAFGAHRAHARAR